MAVGVAQDAGLNPAILLILIGTISLTFLSPIPRSTMVTRWLLDWS